MRRIAREREDVFLPLPITPSSRRAPYAKTTGDESGGGGGGGDKMRLNFLQLAFVEVHRRFTLTVG